jgi:choline kinase
MRAIILAAGTGSRLGGTTTKALIEVNGKKMIDYLLDFLNLELFDEIFVVGGFHFADLSDYLSSKQNPKIKVLENTEYLKGNIYTMFRALNEFNDDSFLLTNSDHIYPSVMFEKMEKSFQHIMAMCDFDRNLGIDDMKVRTNDDTGCIEAIDKKLEYYNCGYIGMTFVHKDYFNLYKKAADYTIAKKEKKAVVENILQTLSYDPQTAPYICDLSGFGWYEVDDEMDMVRAQKNLLTNKNFTN